MTQSLEDYLEAIYNLSAVRGEQAQVRDIAKTLGVTMPSVVKAIRELMRLGLVSHEPYSGVELTDKGRRLAKMIQSRHLLLRDFLISLGVSSLMADKDACMMEHVVSAETLDKIRIYMSNIVTSTKSKKK
ncbi:MAG: metal-dependent transcriptional regulator [Kiritimatiellae bacterium]|nr:metal-dependent transcriptional regulator [Kiritimatiellia bacterium]